MLLTDSIRKWYQDLNGATNNTAEKRSLEVYVLSCNFVESKTKC